MNYKLSLKIFFLAVGLCSGIAVFAQSASVVVKGKVTDHWNRPVAAATVSSSNGKNGTITNNAGEYVLTVNDNSDQFTISKNGYKSVTNEVISSQSVNAQLQDDIHQEYEVVQTGYTAQLRKDISGAVSSVKGEVLERAPVANFTQTLAGRLPGLTTMETFSELSRATTNLYARGVSSDHKNSPLVVIDGIPVAYNASQSLEYISPNEVESVSLLKDAASQAIYGIQGANGVLVVTTKRGTKGPLRIQTTFDESVQQVTTHPVFINASEYATLRNQASVNDGGDPLFTADQIAKYQAGNDPLYPNTNWYNYFVKDLANMQRASVNLDGGNDRVQFYSNLNVMHQGGYFKTDQTQYDPNANNVWVNFRTNVDMTINKYLKTYIRLAGNVKRERTPGSGNSDVYSSIFQLPSNLYGPTTPDGEVIATTNIPNPTYGMLNRSGYYRHTVTNVTTQFGLDLDMSFLTKGLSASGLFAYQTNSVGSLATTQDYARFVRSDNLDSLSFSQLGAHINEPLKYSKSGSYYYHLSYKANLNYARTFGLHSINAMAYMFYQDLTKADVGSPALLPYNRVSSGVELNYAYNSKYLAKLDWAYSGSEQYARNKRYIGTPAASVAWVASNENFLKDQDWLSLLKIRAAYGKTANDQSGLNRFAYLNDIRLGNGGPIGFLQYMITENTKGNPNVGAETSVKKNLGLDIGLFHAVTITADLFNEHMNNMLVDAIGTIPAYQGIPLDYYPMFNTGVFDNKGYEIALNYKKQLSPDLGFNIGGMYSYSKNTVVSADEGSLTTEYAYRKRTEGYSVGQQWGYLVDKSNGNGYFNTQEELAADPLYYTMGNNGKVRLGDLKYRDLNADGIIDNKDLAPIGTGSLPRAVYAFNGGINYKSFELNFLFQGIGQYTTLQSGIGIYDDLYDGVFGSLHRDAWTQERYDNGEPITAPALSITNNASHQASDFYAYNMAYLRLKNVEFLYTLPAAASKAIHAQNIRLVLSGQNLITWDKMKSGDFGPEGGGYSGFPVYRVYNIGVKVTF